MLAVSASVLILALAVLVVRYDHVRFPYGRGEEKNSERRCKKTLDGVLLSGCNAL